MHLSMLSPRGGGWGGRADHGILIVSAVPRVGILIVRDAPKGRVGKFDMVAILPFRHLGKYPEGIWTVG